MRARALFSAAIAAVLAVLAGCGAEVQFSHPSSSTGHGGATSSSTSGGGGLVITGTATGGAGGEGNCTATLTPLVISQADPCTFPVTATGGQPIDPLTTFVVVTPAGGGSPITLGQVPDAASCGAAEAWYLLDTKPQQIILCTASCAAFVAGKITAPQLLIGCPTSP